MTIRGIGELRQADEGLNHQIVDTFATVGQSDRSWAEKIWGSLAKADGSLQVDFGLGRYQNRGILDGFGGVSRGREQWIVRGSRELAPAWEEASVGPIRYEIVEPLKRVRFVLEPNEAQPISFDLVLTGVMAPSFLYLAVPVRMLPGEVSSSVRLLPSAFTAATVAEATEVSAFGHCGAQAHTRYWWFRNEPPKAPM